MAAMADAQRESATQIRALLALFHQSPSSASLSTPPRPTPLRPTPLLLTQEASAGETGETLVDALPFLAEYDCSALIVSNLRCAARPVVGGGGKRRHVIDSSLSGWAQAAVHCAANEPGTDAFGSDTPAHRLCLPVCRRISRVQSGWPLAPPPGAIESH
jgi:hypothetical protein